VKSQHSSNRQGGYDTVSIALINQAMPWYQPANTFFTDMVVGKKQPVGAQQTVIS